ncbi:MAG: radical SAM protein [Elusimicrobiota bacterium]
MEHLCPTAEKDDLSCARGATPRDVAVLRERLPALLAAVLGKTRFTIRPSTAPGAMRLDIPSREGSIGIDMRIRPGVPAAGAGAPGPARRFAVHCRLSRERDRRASPKERKILDLVRLAIVKALKTFENDGSPEPGRGIELTSDISQMKECEGRPGKNRSRPGREAMLRISFACNQNCRFCFVDLSKKIVPLEVVERRLAALARNGSAGAQLTISGGDPTTHPRLAEIIASARGMHFERIVLQTNGVYLSKPGLVRALGPLAYFVSLHSHVPAIYDRLTRSWRQFPLALRGIKNILAFAGNVLIVNVVITSLNCADLPGYVDFVAGLGRPPKARIFFSMLNEVGLLKAPELGVDLKVAAHFLNKALSRCRTRGLQVEHFVGNCSIPLCQVDDPAPYASNTAYSRVDVRYQDDFTGCETQGRAKRTGCGTCLYDEKCRGVSVVYAQRFGLDALRPVAKGS